jgi:hypothetical protein
MVKIALQTLHWVKSYRRLERFIFVLLTMRYLTCSSVILGLLINILEFHLSVQVDFESFVFHFLRA